MYMGLPPLGLTRVNAPYPELRVLEGYGATDAWDFIADQYIRSGTVGPSGLTVTRASSGYAETADGTLVNFGSGVLRRTDKGVLVEGARTNLLLRSQEFDNASWTKQRATITANATTAPDGTLTADKLVEDNTASNNHRTLQSVSTTGQAYAFTVFAKASERNWMYLRIDRAGSTTPVAWFNLSAGTVGTVNTGLTAAIQALANGWYRCRIVVDTADTTNNSILIGLATGNTVLNYTGDNTSGIFIWGAQLEEAPFASSYIPTVASTVTRAADEVTASLSGVAYPLSLYAEFVRNGDTGAAEAVLQVDASSRAQRSLIFVTDADLLAFASRGAGGAGGAGDSSVTGGVTVGAIQKGAARVQTDNVILARNGTLGSADTAAIMPASPDTVRFGDSGPTPTYGFNYIRRAAIFNAGLSDADLQGVTS